MKTSTRLSLVLALTALAVLASAVGPSGAGTRTAAAARPPAPASNLAVARRYDHTLVVTFSVPAAFYHPGAGAVVRMTRGLTPAPSPTTGYAVPLVGHTATARPLTANATYTFAVWIRDNGVYSARRTLTGTTVPDVTAPLSLMVVNSTAKTTTAARPSVMLRFSYQRVDVDQAGLRIIRNTVPTITGSVTITVAGAPETWVDPDADRAGTHYYYWAIPYDTSGHYAAHYRASDLVMPTTHRISGTLVPGRYDEEPVVWASGPLAFTTSGRTVSTEDNWAMDSATRWHMDLPPGRYTLCQAASADDTGLHFHVVSGCAAPAEPDGWEIADWGAPDEQHLPPASVGAVDSTRGPVSAIPVGYYWS